MKKSYHSIVVPIAPASATRRASRSDGPAITWVISEEAPGRPTLNSPYRMAPGRAVGRYADVRLVPKLRLRVAFFIYRAIPAFRNHAVTLSGAQDAGCHHPGLHEIFGILDGHVVADFISDPRESFDDVHVGGMQEAA